MFPFYNFTCIFSFKMRNKGRVKIFIEMEHREKKHYFLPIDRKRNLKPYLLVS